MAGVVITFYPYITNKYNEMSLMDTELCVHHDIPDESDSPGFESIGEAKMALTTLSYRLQDFFGRPEEDFAGFGILASDGYRWYIKRGEYEKLKHYTRYIPYAEDSAGTRYFLDEFAAFENTINPERAWHLPTLEGAKRKLPYVHRTLLDDCVVSAFTKVGVMCSDEQVFSEWRQLPLQTGNPDEFYLYIEDEQGRKIFYKEAGIDSFPTLDWGNAKKFSTVGVAKATIPEFAKQPIGCVTPRDSRIFGVVNGVGELVFEGPAEWYTPYACAEDGADLFLCKDDQEELTRDQNKAWGAPTLDLASEKAKQIHRIAFDSNQALLGTSVGVYSRRGEIVDADWSDLVFSGEKSNLYFPYVLDTYDSRTYLLETSGTPHQWTQFLCDAQGYTNVEDAKNMIQRLVELTYEDCYFPEDLRVGVMNGYGNKFFEDAIVCPASVVDEPEVSDPVNNPEHYKTGGLEAIDVVEAFFADNYLRGNVFKYIARAGKKDPNKKVEDLQKAAWYLNREIEALKGDCA